MDPWPIFKYYNVENYTGMVFTADKKLEVICDRIGFTVARRILSFKHGVTASSQNEFISKLAAAMRSKPSIESAIDSFWKDLLLGGERLAHLHKVKTEDIAKLDKALKRESKRATNNPFQNLYPYPLNSKKLGTVDTNFHVMDLSSYSSPDNNSDLTVAVICSKASYTTTEPIEQEYLSKKGVSLLGDTEIICRRRNVTQCFDLIIYDKNSDFVLVAADASVLTSSIESRNQLEKLKGYIRTELSMDLVFDRPSNVFPAIPNLYERKDGRISLLAFVTSDGNPSTLRAKAFKVQCLRADAYHKGGESKARVLNKYKLGKQWVIPIEENLNVAPGLEINGIRKMAEGGVDPLYHFKLLNCFSLKQTMFTVDKLVAAL